MTFKIFISVVLLGKASGIVSNAGHEQSNDRDTKSNINKDSKPSKTNDGSPVHSEDTKQHSSETYQCQNIPETCGPNSSMYGSKSSLSLRLVDDSSTLPTSMSCNEQLDHRGQQEDDGFDSEQVKFPPVDPQSHENSSRIIGLSKSMSESYICSPSDQQDSSVAKNFLYNLSAGAGDPETLSISEEQYLEKDDISNEFTDMSQSWSQSKQQSSETQEYRDMSQSWSQSKQQASETQEVSAQILDHQGMPSFLGTDLRFRNVSSDVSSSQNKTSNNKNESVV